MRLLEKAVPYCIVFVSLLATVIFTVFNAKVFTNALFEESSHQLSSSVTTLVVLGFVVVSVIVLKIYEKRKAN